MGTAASRADEHDGSDPMTAAAVIHHNSSPGIPTCAPSFAALAGKILPRKKIPSRTAAAAIKPAITANGSTSAEPAALACPTASAGINPCAKRKPPKPARVVKKCRASEATAFMCRHPAPVLQALRTLRAGITRCLLLATQKVAGTSSPWHFQPAIRACHSLAAATCRCLYRKTEPLQSRNRALDAFPSLRTRHPPGL